VAVASVVVSLSGSSPEDGLSSLLIATEEGLPCVAARGGVGSAGRAAGHAEHLSDRLLGRGAAEQPAAGQDRVDPPEHGAQPARTMLSRQLVVDVAEKRSWPSLDPAALRPAEGQEAHRIAVGQRLQQERRKQMGLVRQVSHQLWNVALATGIAAAGHGSAIAPEQDRVAKSSGNLSVGQGPRWRVQTALAITVPATSHCGTIAHEQHRVIISSGNLRANDRAIQATVVPLLQRQDATLTMIIATEGHGNTIDPEQHRVIKSSGKLRVGKATHQLMESALAIRIVTASYGSAIASEQDRVIHSSRNSRVDQISHQPWDVALTIRIVTASHNGTIAPEQNCVAVSSGNLCVGQAPHQLWKVALTMTTRISTTGRDGAIAPEQDRVEPTSCNLRVGLALRKRREAALTIAV